uniref:Polymerase nucleotidyl transferase domain-containing protein n=1 Tax=Candidatus Kentrum sp. FM TaxID=2126340 RepID=A0A450W362_9GAMM|nr:MAG: hypothetical protein BECKFM1743C_GA0114222_101241 [Candidatus Kentron sp. FM]VFJ53834.1 MAG: hypothetical protein BECKFM1743A_GA0114220_101211 [Candidatus Kentron sp. FM]VFK11517.1 MAG: hypothetical protein BECKFM1743B_GA0114221_101881 [Candidatus Kentron sp. FM]
MNHAILSPHRLQTLLKDFLARHGEEYHLLALGYFGSYARGEATPDSDVDVVFKTDKPDLFVTAMMKQDIEAMLNRPVDVVRLRDKMNPGLKSRIEQEAIYV